MKKKLQSTFRFATKQLEQDGCFSGYASVFNVVDQHNDTILPGAFELTGASVPILWQHQFDQPIGKTTEIKQDAKGLYVAANLILEINKGYEAYKLLEKEVINGLSIGYILKKHNIDSKNAGRIITSLELVEISLVTFPANQQSMVNSLKSTKEKIVTKDSTGYRHSAYSKIQEIRKLLSENM